MRDQYVKKFWKSVKPGVNLTLEYQCCPILIGFDMIIESNL